MKLKKECIGARIKIKDRSPIIIEDDPKNFALYKSLGLDVFVKERKKKSAETNEGHNEQ